jgi:hypothetical protein
MKEGREMNDDDELTPLISPMRREIWAITQSHAMRELLCALITGFRHDNPSYKSIGIVGYLGEVAKALAAVDEPVLCMIADDCSEGDTRRNWRCRPDIDFLRTLAAAALEVRPALRKLGIDS